MPGEPIVEMRGVTVTVGRATLLRDVDLQIGRGERVAVLGPNGSGKSTLIKTMTGDLRRDTSRPGSYVRIRGEEMWDLFEVRRAFGIVSGELQVDLSRPMDAAEAVLSGFFGSIGTNRSQELSGDMERRALDALSSVGSEHLARRKLNTLSMGEARRVLMARALVHDPEALILDEPMNSLDLTGKHLVRQAMISLARSERTIIMVTHDPSDIIPGMERVVMMKDGRIFRDGTIDLLNEESLSALFGVPVKLRREEGRCFAWS